MGKGLGIYDNMLMNYQIQELEKKDVFIHYESEKYNSGTNLCFSIEFKNYNAQTGWYNDNHEFGDVLETVDKSIKLAKWYLDNPKRIELIDSKYNNSEYIQYVNELSDFINILK
jgi:hypothetical protein